MVKKWICAPLALNPRYDDKKMIKEAFFQHPKSVTLYMHCQDKIYSYILIMVYIYIFITLASHRMPGVLVMDKFKFAQKRQFATSAFPRTSLI